MASDDDVTVRRLLAAMGIVPPDEEVDAMIKTYPALRAAADSLYAPEPSLFLPSYLAAEADLSGSSLEAK